MGQIEFDTSSNAFYFSFFLLQATIIGFFCCCCFKEPVINDDENNENNQDQANTSNRRTRRRRRNADSDSAEALLEERKAMIEAKVIKRRVIAAESHEKKRGVVSKAVSDLGNGPRAYSSFVAAFCNINRSNRSIEFSELPSQQGVSSMPPVRLTDVFNKDQGKSMSQPNLMTAIALQGDEEEQKDIHQIDVKESDEQDASKSTRVKRRKCNIVARAISTSFRNNNDDYATSCDICLMDYEVGEDVCWSRNEECIHAFHKECIVDWLLKSPNCPCCRRNYLDPPRDEESKEDTTSQV